MVTIWLDQLLSNSEIYEPSWLGKIKKLYKSAVKGDDQCQYKGIIEEDMVLKPEGFNDNIPIFLGTYMTVNNSSSIK